ARGVGRREPVRGSVGKADIAETERGIRRAGNGAAVFQPLQSNRQSPADFGNKRSGVALSNSLRNGLSKEHRRGVAAIKCGLVMVLNLLRVEHSRVHGDLVDSTVEIIIVVGSPGIIDANVEWLIVVEHPSRRGKWSIGLRAVVIHRPATAWRRGEDQVG